MGLSQAKDSLVWEEKICNFNKVIFTFYLPRNTTLSTHYPQIIDNRRRICHFDVGEESHVIMPAYQIIII